MFCAKLSLPTVRLLGELVNFLIILMLTILLILGALGRDLRGLITEGVLPMRWLDLIRLLQTLSGG